MSEGDSVGESVHGKPSVVYRFFTRLGQIYQSWLDKSTPYTAVRWVVTLGLSFVYMIRVYLLQGWYIVTYALGIYHLNLFIAFLSPKVDPSLMEDSDDGPSLPTKQNEEFRPFIRRLPEFKFWHAATKGILVAMVCTFFDAFNVPVFWPILVMYFIMLFCITMKRQIKHMIKYRYIPFTHGKRSDVQVFLTDGILVSCRREARRVEPMGARASGRSPRCQVGRQERGLRGRNGPLPASRLPHQPQVCQPLHRARVMI
uniref:Protein RER1 n=1 Tax=Macaca fascicularis TaxID=9541 RepID=A0A7N9D1P5_MACFA